VREPAQKCIRKSPNTNGGGGELRCWKMQGKWKKLIIVGRGTLPTGLCSKWYAERKRKLE